MRFFQWPGSGRVSHRTTAQNRMRPCRLEVETLENRLTPSTFYGVTPGNTLIRFDAASPGTIQASTPITGLQSNTG